MTERVWDKFLTEHDKARLALSPKHPRDPRTYCEHPALLLIDYFRGVYGYEPQETVQAMAEWPGSCGLTAWEKIAPSRQLLDTCRSMGMPIIHTTGVIEGEIAGQHAQPRPKTGTTLPNGRKWIPAEVRYEIIPEMAPADGETIIRKVGASAFFGTPLLGHLIANKIDTLIVCGESTSGCVRASVVDADQYQFNVILVEDCTFDRHEATHAMNLFDMHRKFADVLSLNQTLSFLGDFASRTPDRSRQSEWPALRQEAQMPRPRFSYSPIPRRPKLEMPNGARLALWAGINIEYYDFNDPIQTAGAVRAPSPSPMGYGHYSYGMRVGIFRLMDILDKHGMRGSALLNSDVCSRFPEILEEGNKRDWVWLGHGQRNGVNQHSFLQSDIETERAYLREMVDIITRETGMAPNGWLGPGGSETYDTLDLLAECGLTYVCDWTADDQPFALRVNNGKMINVPYAVDGLNDIRQRDRAFTGEDYYQLIVDQFDMLYEDAKQNPRVMCIAIHPHISGQPFRARGLDRALDYISGHEAVWKATSDEIADWFYASGYYQPEPA